MATGVGRAGSPNRIFREEEPKQAAETINERYPQGCQRAGGGGGGGVSTLFGTQDNGKIGCQANTPKA